MPSAAAIALSSGFSALLASNGEDLTLTRADGATTTLQALVQWTDHSGGIVPSFMEGGGSIVEMFRTATSPAPLVGEHFTDENGITHRINKVWPPYMAFMKLWCETTEAA